MQNGQAGWQAGRGSVEGGLHGNAVWAQAAQDCCLQGHMPGRLMLRQARGTHAESACGVLGWVPPQGWGWGKVRGSVQSEPLQHGLEASPLQHAQP